MNFAIVATVALFSAVNVSVEQIDAKTERNDNASQVAKAWFESLMEGSTAVTTSLSEVPFDFDGKQELKTHADLKQLYDKVVSSKGKRDIKLAAAKIKSSSAQTVEVALAIEGDDEEIVVTVKVGDACRVVGFVD